MTSDIDLEKLTRIPANISLNKKEFSSLIALADSLRQYDQRQGEIISKEFIYPSDSYSFVQAFKTAEDLGISADYVAKAVALQYPSPEQQFKDIQSISAKPTTQVILDTYKSDLFDALRRSMPNEMFVVYTTGDNYDKYVHFSRLTETGKNHRVLFWKKQITKKESLAKLAFHNGNGFDERGARTTFHLNVELYHAHFIRACGDALKQLNEKFKSDLAGFNAVYSYVVR